MGCGLPGRDGPSSPQDPHPVRPAAAERATWVTMLVPTGRRAGASCLGAAKTRDVSLLAGWFSGGFLVEGNGWQLPGVAHQAFGLCGERLAVVKCAHVALSPPIPRCGTKGFCDKHMAGPTSLCPVRFALALNSVAVSSSSENKFQDTVPWPSSPSLFLLFLVPPAGSSHKAKIIRRFQYVADRCCISN